MQIVCELGADTTLNHAPFGRWTLDAARTKNPSARKSATAGCTITCPNILVGSVGPPRRHRAESQRPRHAPLVHGADACQRLEPPQLTPTLFLSGREDACAKLKDVVSGTSVQLKLDTHFPDHVVDFVSAYLADLDAESRADATGRWLVVSDAEAWRAMAGACSSGAESRNCGRAGIPWATHAAAPARGTACRARSGVRSCLSSSHGIGTSPARPCRRRYSSPGSRLGTGSAPGGRVPTRR